MKMSDTLALQVEGHPILVILHLSPSYIIFSSSLLCSIPWRLITGDCITRAPLILASKQIQPIENTDRRSKYGRSERLGNLFCLDTHCFALAPYAWQWLYASQAQCLLSPSSCHPLSLRVVAASCGPSLQGPQHALLVPLTAHTSKSPLLKIFFFLRAELNSVFCYDSYWSSCHYFWKTYVKKETTFRKLWQGK